MTRRGLSVRGLTEGAILAGLVALFALATQYIPLLGVASALVCPLPLTLLVVRHSLRVGVLASLVSSLIAGMIGGPLTGLTILLTFAPLGITLGLAIRARMAGATALVICSVVATASLIVNLAVTLLVSGFNPYTAMIQGMQQGQDTALQFYTRLGIDPARFEQMNAAMRQILDLMPRLIPVLVVVGGASVAYTNFEVTRFALRRFGVSLTSLPPISSWRVPGWFLWVLPLGLALVWVARAAPVPIAGPVQHMLPTDDLRAIAASPASRFPFVETAGLNLSVLAQMVYSMLGLVAGWVLLERYGAPRWLRWMALAFAFTTPSLGIAVFFLGIADAAFDLRGRWRRTRVVETSA